LEGTSWLRQLGLPQYAQRFAENGIDFSILRDLIDEDLKVLGVLLGHHPTSKGRAQQTATP
jgi:SAM domain (Sterile alpha motif)